MDALLSCGSCAYLYKLHGPDLLSEVAMCVRISMDGNRARSWSWLAVAHLFAMAYVVTAEFSYWLSLTPVGFATFWLPNALALTVLLNSPRRHWPVLVLAALTADLVSAILIYHETLFLVIGGPGAMGSLNTTRDHCLIAVGDWPTLAGAGVTLSCS
jgi:hypothetical protein